MKQKPECLKDVLIIGMFMLGVIFLRVFYMIRTIGPFIYADEFGYWSHAAHMTGHIWTGAMDGVAWYSFGYSFWLALTFLFADNMIIMYRMAILMNVLMSLAIYAIAYAIIRRYLKEQESLTCGLVAFAVTSYPTYIFYTYTTMCETLLAMLVWLIFYELISLEENPKWWKAVLLGITAGYAYMVHNRLLTTLLAVGICVAILWICRKIDWKIILPFALSMLAMLAIYVIVKDYLKEVLAAGQVSVGRQNPVMGGKPNTFGAVWTSFLSVFTPERIVKPLRSLMGQLWQCLSATYLLAGIGLVYMIQNLKRNLSERQNICDHVYPVLAFLFSVGLTSVIAFGPNPGTAGRVRIDSAFYGRYNECYYPLLIMMGLILLCKGEMRIVRKSSLAMTVLYLALSVGMLFRLQGLDGYLNIVSAIGIHIFHWLGEFSVWKCSLAAMFGSGLIIGLCHFRRIERLGCYAGMLALIFLFSTTALYCMRLTIRGEYDYTKQCMPIYDYLNENTVKGELVYTTGENKAAYDLQSRLVNKAVVSMPAERIAEIKENVYAVVHEEQMEEFSGIEYEICLECGEFLILRLN